MALGTDGRGSNPDLSIWNEIRWLAQHHPQTDPALLLRLGTLDGEIQHFAAIGISAHSPPETGNPDPDSFGEQRPAHPILIELSSMRMLPHSVSPQVNR